MDLSNRRGSTLNIIIPIFGILTLLWNGHVFSNYQTQTPFSVFCAVATTIVWLYLFISAYQRAYH